ncbi:MAG: zf-HC2 domain-containing protein [Burkholderiales bacterium]
MIRLTCKDAARLLSHAHEQPLGGWARLRLRLHLTICDACTNFRRQLDFIREALRRLRDGA